MTAGLDHDRSDAHFWRVEPDQGKHNNQTTLVGLDRTAPDTRPRGVEPNQKGTDNHGARVGLDHDSGDTHLGSVEPDQIVPDTQMRSVGLDQNGYDTQAALVELDQTAGDNHAAIVELDVADARLLIVADTLDDLERARIAAENRLRAMVQVKGLEGSPDYARLEGLVAAIGDLEHRAELELKRALRQHPLGGWVRDTVGIGEKQGARLLAAIGDPAWNAAEGRPRRGPAELWAYCGFHVIEGARPRRQRGVKANWNGTAKMRARLVAESCMKQRRSPYRAVYDREREKWADRETSDLHKHNHALAVVAKEVLKDLWRAATALSKPTSDTPRAPTSPTPIGGARAAKIATTPTSRSPRAKAQSTPIVAARAAMNGAGDAG